MCDGMARGVLGCRGLSSYTMSNQKHIVLAGGGTAGHVNPLLAVAHVIRELEPDADIAVVGTVVAWNMIWFPRPVSNWKPLRRFLSHAGPIWQR